MSTDPKQLIADAVASAEELPDPVNDRGDEEPDHYGRGGGPEGLREAPFKCLGVGPNAFYFRDAAGYVQEIVANALPRTKIIQIVGNSNWLYRHYPRTDKDGNVTGWNLAKLSEAMIDGCNHAGGFNPGRQLRGRGCWRDHQGRLVFHAGDKLWVGKEPTALGVHDGYVYGKGEALPAPIFDGGRKAMDEVFETLRSWNWHRGDADAKLVLGGMGAGWLGAFSRWRPGLWISGDTNTGKSLLFELRQELFGSALLSSADASRAALFQTLQYDCLPIAIDELEPDADPRMQDAVIKLMRHAASGAVILRGGADGKAMGFTARSAFSFSSILLPPMMGQDINRLAICELGPVTAKKSLGDLSRFAMHGRKMIGRLITEAYRYDATFEAYRNALLASGHNVRGADTFGAIGAAYDLLMYDAFDQGSVEAWAAMLPRGRMIETSEAESDSLRCLRRLLSYAPQIFRSGKTETLSWWLRQAKEDVAGTLSQDNAAESDAVRILASCGLRIEVEDNWATTTLPADRRKWFVAVSNSMEGTGAIFANSHWQMRPSTTGVWVQALRRLDGAKADKTWIDGQSVRCTLLPWDAVFPPRPAPEQEYEPGQDG